MDTVVVRHDASGDLDPLEVCRTLAARGVQTVLLGGRPAHRRRVVERRAHRQDRSVRVPDEFVSGADVTGPRSWPRER